MCQVAPPNNPAGKLKTYNRHGLHKHGLYRRWNSFMQRCYSPDSQGYLSYGFRGIGVHADWHQRNEQGISNFIKWVDNEMLKHPEFKEYADFDIGRKDVDKDFSPDNCKLVAAGKMVFERRTKQLDFDMVVRMRRYKRAYPTTSLSWLSAEFRQSDENVSRALRGITWTHVNEVEPPIPKSGTEAYRQLILDAPAYARLYEERLAAEVELSKAA